MLPFLCTVDNSDGRWQEAFRLVQDPRGYALIVYEMKVLCGVSSLLKNWTAEDKTAAASPRPEDYTMQRLGSQLLLVSRIRLSMGPPPTTPPALSNPRNTRTVCHRSIL